MIIWWILFGLFILAMITLDLGLINRQAHVIRMKEAFLWTSFWISLAVIFGIGVYLVEGTTKSLEFFTAYLIEYSLSIDNIFVFLLIFKYFSLPRELEHKALFWGIILALITRLLFILTGVTLIKTFAWITYIFGAFLVFTGVKMAFSKDIEVHPDRNVAIRLLRLFSPVTKEFHGARFFVRQNGGIMATPMLAIVLVLESTDILFAVDSIPAVLAVSKDPFIVYTSNVFAILGLRSLFFALAGLMRLFHHLHYGLAAILSFVGIKMLLEEIYHFPITISLLIISLLLALSILSSLLWPEKKSPPDGP
ncbi:MAG TPA: TerC family protein [Syntrophales bacterium]|nr:TerC family protein [Syntrophales bacterium]HOL60111.1 TerC family protein [Syntrophales bacterium]